MKILVYSELSNSVYRVGREAQLLALAEKLADRQHQIVLVASPGENLAKTDAPVSETIEIFKFPSNRVECLSLLENIEKYLAGEQLALVPKVEGDFAYFVEDIRTVDSLLIIENEALSSRDSAAIYERAALVAVAKHLGKPVVFSSQVVGSPLSQADEMVLARTYSRADRVGVADERSRDWCAEHGIRASASLDLATLFNPGQRLLDGSEYFDFIGGIGELPDTYVSVSLSDLSEQQIALAATALDRLHAQTRLCIVFVPHQSNPLTQDGDVALHRKVASRMWSPTVVAPAIHADQAAMLHHGAAFTLTTSFRAAALSLGQGVPAYGLYTGPDSYHSFYGMLSNFGLQDFIAPLNLLGSETVHASLREMAEHFYWGLYPALREQSQKLRDFAQSWWNAVDDTLSGERVARMPLPAIPAAEPLKAGEESSWRSDLAMFNSMTLELMNRAVLAEVETEVTLGWSAIYERERDFALQRAREAERALSERESSNLAEAEPSKAGFGRLFGRS